MRAFLTRRLFLLVPTLLGVTLATFLMLHLTPGDPVTIMLGEFASASDVARLRSELGLDRPIVVQYLKFLGRAVRGDLGSSIRSRRPVAEEITERLPPTLVLALAAQVLAVCAGIIAGVTAAAARRPSVDSAIVAVTLVGLSMPTFWSGLLLILLFSLTLGWLPITESGGLRALILPSVTLAAPAAAVLARVTRASVLEVLRQDYVRTARAKGVSERLVVYRHALRNALIPVLTVAALQFAGLVAGAVIVESVFSRDSSPAPPAAAGGRGVHRARAVCDPGAGRPAACAARSDHADPRRGAPPALAELSSRHRRIGSGRAEPGYPWRPHLAADRARHDRHRAGAWYGDRSARGVLRRRRGRCAHGGPGSVAGPSPDFGGACPFWPCGAAVV